MILYLKRKYCLDASFIEHSELLVMKNYLWKWKISKITFKNPTIARQLRMLIQAQVTSDENRDLFLNRLRTNVISCKHFVKTRLLGTSTLEK